MHKFLVMALCLVGSTTTLAFDEAALKAEMRIACSSLFAEGGKCANLAKGTRNCVIANQKDGGEACESFAEAHEDFFEAGKNDPTIYNM